MLPEEELYYRIALTLVPGIGPRKAGELLAVYGSAAAVFKSGLVQKFDNFAEAEHTLTFARKHGIHIYCPCDPEYPSLLKECADAPPVLYYKGAASLNPPRVLSIVGTRTPSLYGKQAVKTLLQELAPYGVLIISGLADGIDTLAHRYALDKGLPTVGVLGHGLHTIYPAGNRLLAKAILDKGGLLTEYRQGQGPAAFHFPLRNRIIAGISPATIVIESGADGGSIITAKLAFDYHREVFALPGRITDSRSQGCLHLVKDNIAALMTGSEDIARDLRWTVHAQEGRRAHPVRDKLLDLLRDQDSLHLDELTSRSGLSTPELAATLLILELGGAIESLPGNRYRLIL